MDLSHTKELFPRLHFRSFLAIEMLNIATRCTYYFVYARVDVEREV